MLDTLTIKPETERERVFAEAMLQVEAENLALRRRMMELQASNILNEAYCTVLREQLAFKTGKAKKKKEEISGRLMGDGLPVLLTGDFFYERVVEWEKEQSRKKTQKEDRRVAKEARNARLDKWKEQCQERLKDIEEINAAWEVEKVQWAKRKQQWSDDKAAGKRVPARFGVPQPKRGPLPKAIPRPKLRERVETASDEGTDADDEGEDERSDSD
ncbi:hypothetical protein BDZ89DRAFT_966568 [Hymenopellis radicata]|nr:hypothetical protein BDZ89DRAFT_966568 [Hymenopellis radicata]